MADEAEEPSRSDLGAAGPPTLESPEPFLPGAGDTSTSRSKCGIAPLLMRDDRYR